MLDSTKHNLREKILNCIKEGNAGINTKLDNLENRVSLSEASIKQYSRQFVSPEYVLDSMRALNAKKPRVLVCGYYGARNLGDELMLNSLLKKLDSKKLDITILTAPHFDKDLSIYAPYSVIHYPSRNDDILLLAQNYDYIIWGGGAVLDDEYYDFNFLNIPLAYILLKASIAALKCGKKVFVLGVSTNKTLKNPEFIRDLETVVNGADFFSLRDTNSLRTIKEAGIDTAKIKIIDDLALLDLPKITKPKASGKVSVALTFIFSDENLPKIKEFLKLIPEVLPKLYPGKSVDLHFVPFYDENDFDKHCIEKLLADAPKVDNIAFCAEEFRDKIEDLAELYSSCDLNISMRYHATLLSSVCGVKTLSLDYGSEHRHYYNKLAYIKEHYSNFVAMPFSNIDNKNAVTKAFQELQTLTPSPVSTQSFKDTADLLAKLLKI